MSGLGDSYIMGQKYRKIEPMQLSKRTQYGIRAMVCLAENYNRGYLQTRELAAREGIPSKFLEAILASLARARFLTSKIGATGGYRLQHAPEDVPVSEIVLRLEGRRMTDEPEALAATGNTPGEIGVSLIHTQLTVSLQRVLKSITLADLTRQVQENSPGNQMYYI